MQDVVRHLKEGIVEGRVRDLDPVLEAHAIIGMTSHLARTFLFDADEPIEDLADAAVAICLHGILD